jgi:hypothetical protein
MNSEGTLPENGKSRPGLDFIVIGAQKSGTTSLDEILRTHPGIILPFKKEVYFFATPEYGKVAAWEKFLRDSFPAREQGKIVGKATPQYMIGTVYAERIRKFSPQTKIVAILRNPIARCHSQYAMYVRNGEERRSFSEALQSQLRPENRELVAQSGAKPVPETETYLGWGEYGRILEAYFQSFPREQILVLFTEDLAERPEATVRSLFSFLGVDSTWHPPNATKRYNSGGAIPPAAQLWRFLRNRRLPILFYKWLIPPSVKGWLHRRIGFYSGLSKRPIPSLTPDEHRLLVEYYHEDVRKLRALLGGVGVPWPEFETEPAEVS